MFRNTTGPLWQVQLHPLPLDVMNTFIDLVNFVILSTITNLHPYFTFKRQGATFS